MNTGSQDQFVITGENSEIESDKAIINFLGILNPIIRRKRLFLITSSLTILIGILITIRNRIVNPVYIGNFTLLVSDPLNMDNGNPEDNSQVIQNLAINNSNNNIPTLIEFMKSTLALEPIATKFNISPKELKARLEIENKIPKRYFRISASDGVLDVNLYSKNPKKDQTLLEALSNHYLTLSSSQRQKKLQEGLDFLNSQEPLLQEKTINLQTELVKFRKENSLLEPLEEGLLIKERQKEIEKELSELELNQGRIKNAKEGIISGTLSTSGFQDVISITQTTGAGGLTISDFDKSIVEELLVAESELAKALSKYKEESLMIQALRKRIDEIKPIIIQKQLKATETALSLNEEKIFNLKNQLSDIEELFQLQPDLIKKYNTLKQRLELSRENLLGLVSARESFQLKIAQSRIPWQIIEPPRMGKKVVQPRIKRSLAITVFLSVLLGGIATFLRDKLDNFFHNINDVKNFTNLPILGNFPFIGSLSLEPAEDSEGQTYLEYFSKDNASKDDLDFEDEKKKSIYNKFIVQESLRNIYSSIRFLNPDNEIKSICITSSIPGEGKSLINIFLAKTIAEIDKKVLLVDADLRRSQIHKRLRLNNLKGLSNYLTSSKDQDYNNYIQSVDNIPNLKVMTAGISPPNSAQLLNSNKMDNFIKELKDDKNFDYVFFDMPPILGIADASLLANKIDAFFLIITLENISKSIVGNSIQRSKIAGTKIEGIIVNSVNQDKKNIIGNKYFDDYTYAGYSNYIENIDINSEKSSDKNKTENSLKLLKGDIKSNIIDVFKRFTKWIDK